MQPLSEALVTHSLIYYSVTLFHNKQIQKLCIQHISISAMGIFFSIIKLSKLGVISGRGRENRFRILTFSSVINFEQ